MHSHLAVTYYKHNLHSMKKLFFTLLIACPGMAFCQNLPVQLNVQSLKAGNNLFIIQIEVQIKEGWYAFAKYDPVLGIEPFSVLLENQNILFPNNKETGDECKTIVVKDPLFGRNSFSVFTNKITLEKTVKVFDNIPFLVIKLEGFVSDNKQIVSVEITKEVKIKI